MLKTVWEPDSVKIDAIRHVTCVINVPLYVDLTIATKRVVCTAMLADFARFCESFARFCDLLK